MQEFKGTPGPWEKLISKNDDIIVRAKRLYPNRDLYELNIKTGHIYDDDCGNKNCCNVAEHANAQLIASAPDLLEALQVAKDTICSLKLSMNVHPDCTEGSEFDDYTSTAQEVEDQIEMVLKKALGE